MLGMTAQGRISSGFYSLNEGEVNFFPKRKVQSLSGLIQAEIHFSISVPSNPVIPGSKLARQQL